MQYNIGLDIGSTTLKVVVIDGRGDMCYSDYRRHNAGITKVLTSVFTDIMDRFGDVKVGLLVTGSVGMGLTERFNFPFMQEVVASAIVIEKRYTDISTLVDIGGEDSKLILFKDGKTPSMRMNGSCAGGTGAFIDQMASLLDLTLEEMNSLAEQSIKIFPISSRCGVFAKTDIQNLISCNVSKADISASVFHAVALQVVTTLARGCSMNPKILFCGGPFAFIPYLSKAFVKLLDLKEEDYLVPNDANLFPALGCAIDNESPRFVTNLGELIKLINSQLEAPVNREANVLPALFKDDQNFIDWKKKKEKNFVKRKLFKEIESNKCFLGVDSGSTTTKIVLMDYDDNILFSFYSKNKGNPLGVLLAGLNKCNDEAQVENKDIVIQASCVTGYGEDLIKAAFDLDYGIVETIAHYTGAIKFNPNVSFILDIGGQDMKAIFVENGVISRLEINEACSSGCGSFIDGFAENLKYSVSDFANLACMAKDPCDLGTRCTVFMNSKVKQYLRVNANISDIAAGLSFSIIKNMLHKVLKISNFNDLGQDICVQGGTFKNYSVVRAMELIIHKDVSFTDIPELTGAYGAALYAKRQSVNRRHKDVLLSELVNKSFVL